MSLSASATNFAFVADTGTTNPKTVTIPTDVPLHATLVIGILDRADETTTLTSVTDPVNGAWTVASGPTDSGAATHRSWVAYKLDSAALTGTNLVVTVTWSTGISSQLVVGWFADDSESAATHDVTATPAETSPSSTTLTSPSLSAAGAGGMIGFAFNNATVTTITAGGTGESVVKSGVAGERVWAFFETYAAGGAKAFEITTDTSIAPMFHAVAFAVPGGGGGLTANLADPVVGGSVF